MAKGATKSVARRIEFDNSEASGSNNNAAPDNDDKRSGKGQKPSFDMVERSEEIEQPAKDLRIFSDGIELIVDTDEFGDEEFEDEPSDGGKGH